MTLYYITNAKLFFYCYTSFKYSGSNISIEYLHLFSFLIHIFLFYIEMQTLPEKRVYIL